MSFILEICYPNIKKVLEIIIKNRLSEYFKKDNILSNKQYEFRKDRLCERAIQETLTSWKKEISERKKTGSIFIHFKHAFETFDRLLLINELARYGIKGNALKWIKSYPENRMSVKFETLQSCNGLPAASSRNSKKVT